MNSRQQTALGPPPGDLSSFPKWRLQPGDSMLRAHSVGRAPWWFSSGLSGRFDLVSPYGTCYLAVDVTTALRERFGHSLVEQGVVAFESAARTRVSRLRVPAGQWLGNSCHEGAARFGVTRELGTCADYQLPQSWAAALHRSGLSGIRYQTRFTTGPRPNAAAVFGDAGQRDWPADDAGMTGVDACADAGIGVAHLPLRRQLRIQHPPENRS
ncbi:MAG: RES family NAD+ phosphorylase [Actinomycetia bacterium]|nr:RES family NAD+ phosphorylase [Actinomycetes bacterium]